MISGRLIDAVRAAAILLACAAACCFAGPAAAGTMVTPAQNRQMLGQLFEGPIDFYIARGPADACGPGCNEWIAAEGKFDGGAAARFKAFLDSPGRRRLPVFFHSPGGVLADAISMAQLLREYRMSAGVARTSIPGCTMQRRPGGNCDRLVKSGNIIEARLEMDKGQCHSACVFALAGAPRRTIASGALIGIHSPRTDALLWKKYVDSHPDARRLSDEERQLGLWHFVLTLGIDPQIVDLAANVGSKALYLLSRDEIEHFGLNSHGTFETAWLQHDEAHGRFTVVKAMTVTPAAGGASTAMIQLACYRGQGYELTFFRPLAKDEYAPGSSVKLSAGAGEIVLNPGFVSVSNAAYWTNGVRIEDVQKMAAEPAVNLRITFPPAAAPPWSARISTAGLTSALNELQIKCAQRKVTLAAPAPTR